MGELPLLLIVHISIGEEHQAQGSGLEELGLVQPRPIKGEDAGNKKSHSDPASLENAPPHIGEQKILRH